MREHASTMGDMEDRIGRCAAAMPARFLPDQEPMPEAWDESPFSGPSARSSRGTLETLEWCLDRGDLTGAARWLDPASFNVAELGRRNIPSWNARHAMAQARYDLMRAYEAIHGADCLRQEEHRAALLRRWHPFEVYTAAFTTLPIEA